jgi:glycosyltransferase involved in cell wall biosynthesis
MGRLVVVSHKPCWRSGASPSGYATDGGFPIQVRSLAELFDTATVLVPVSSARTNTGELPLVGRNLAVVELTEPPGRGLGRKLLFPFWFLGNARILIREVWGADAVHAPIPGDIGTVGIILALVFHKRLFVRYCGDWSRQRTAAEWCWRWFLEAFAGGRLVVLATGGAVEPPSRRNPAIRWVFSTTLAESELNECAVNRNWKPSGQPRLITVCRQEREKGTGVVIESLPLLLRDFPDATLDVVGDGEALREFRDLAGMRGVRGRVTFHGKVDHRTVLQRLQEADLFCFPTVSSEGFPKVVLEALACGLPVVTTRVSVLPGLIGTGCGVLLDEVTPAAVAEGARLCLSDGARYRAMSGTAVRTARQYSLERWRDLIGEQLRAAWGPLRCLAEGLSEGASPAKSDARGAADTETVR